MDDKDYYEEIEQILRQILQPIEKISFSTFVRVVSGYKIIPINLSKKEDKDLIEDLIKVCEEVIEEIKKTNGIKDKEGKTPNRPNEVGNYIENYVKDVLNKYGYADTPKTQSGSKKSTGYPDIEFWYKGKEEGEGRIVLKLKHLMRKILTLLKELFMLLRQKMRKSSKQFLNFCNTPQYINT
ncbi:putative Type II site-specific deoxyribonuclease [Methanocaldococcus lauensis]|uniref:Putative Type II site-specific deoxyribonuclease n=1 Tax=Methanocaldococcus lauensis TaxID=2546128 RepID=A0A8D6SXZ4_9EURY|nr:hypothetical protein [Methanocaldococcus lauensis]CAB3289181.1 putative Type II site-specific deoxyribonuclease [Methanocaldococcus lauensis]